MTINRMMNMMKTLLMMTVRMMKIVLAIMAIS